MTPRTPEEVFAALIAQGGPSVENTCLYRGPNGRKCAAGWLIADEHYYPDLEHKLAIDHCVSAAIRASGCTLPIETIFKMQRAHDSAAQAMARSNLHSWETVLREKWGERVLP